MTTQLSATQFQDVVVKTFATMALAIADENLEEGDVLLIKDRANSTWDVVLSSGVTENTFNIVQCTGVGTLSLVLIYDKTIYTKQWGCAGDGTNDTAALVHIMDTVAAGDTIVFEPGEYAISAAGGLINQTGLELTNKNNVTITGFGATLYRSDAPTNYNYKPMTVQDCDDFRMYGLTIDNNGSLYFGGFSIYDSVGVTVSKCKFWDSAPGAVTSDRFALIIATSTVDGSDDILVEGNSFLGLQTEFNLRDVRIIGNTFKDSVNRCIGLVSGGTSMVRGDFTVAGNTFDGALDDCITIGIDPSSNNFTVIYNINITGNTYKSTVASGGHFFSSSQIDASNIISNISITNNTMYDTVGNPFVKFDSSNNTAYAFNVNVSNNIYSSTAATVTGPVYNFRYVAGGCVVNNQAIGAGIVDAFKFDRTTRLVITGNLAEATDTAYEITNSTNSSTGIQEFRYNKWRGAPATILALPTGLNLSDVVELDESDFVDVVVVGAGQAVDVAGKKRIRITAAAAASVSTFTQGYYGKEIELHFDNANVTINHGTASNTPRLAGAVNFVGSQYDTLTLVYHTDGRWREKSRAVI